VGVELSDIRQELQDSFNDTIYMKSIGPMSKLRNIWGYLFHSSLFLLSRLSHIFSDLKSELYTFLENVLCAGDWQSLGDSTWGRVSVSVPGIKQKVCNTRSRSQAKDSGRPGARIAIARRGGGENHVVVVPTTIAVNF